MGAGGQPGSGDSASWLQYLSQMFGISPAQAAELSQNGFPASAISALNSGGTAPVNNSINANVVPPASPGPPVGAGLLDQSGVARSPAGVLTPGAPAAQPVAAPAPVPGPLAAGGAAGSAATSNPRFVGIDRPNADPTARRGSPQGTALNLAGLFGGGGQNPNVPAANAQPVSAQRPVPGPLANAPLPPVMPGDIRNQRVKNAIANPNWWQNL